MNDHNRRAKTHLCPAIEKGNFALVEKLLNEGADPNDDVGYRDTPLTTALRNDRDDIAALLIRKGAIVSFTKSDRPPLFFAKSERAVKLLLDNGAKFKIDEILSAVAGSAKPEAVQLLLARSTNANSPLPQGIMDRALVSAVIGDNAPVVELLLAHGAKLIPDIWDYAATPEVATLLLDAGAAPNATSKGRSRHRDVDAVLEGGWTPLHRAARKHRTAVAKVLLDHGAKIGATTEDGLNALHLAASINNDGRPDPKMLMLLLANGIDVNQKDKYGYTALSHAVRFNGCAPNVKVLLTHGANLNCKYWEGRTALHWAAQSGGAETVEMLLNQGASIGVPLVLSQGLCPSLLSQLRSFLAEHLVHDKASSTMTAFLLTVR